MKTKVKIMDTQPVDGDFDDGPIGNHRRNADPDRFLYLNRPLSLAIYTREEPITSGATTLRAVIKHWNAHRNNDTRGRFFRR